MDLLRTPSQTQTDMLTESHPDDQSQSSIPQTESVQDSVNYWFGRLYLKTVLAQKLLEQPDLRTSLPVLQLKLSRELEEFPYSDKLNELWQNGIDTGLDGKSAIHDMTRIRYLRVVGSVMRGDDTRQRNRLLTSLKKYVVAATVEGSSDSDGSAGTLGQQVPSRQVTYPRPPDSVFTSILHEHAAGKKWLLEHDEERLVCDPPAYRCVLKVNGVTFVAEEPLKKHAEHAASKKACVHFGLLRRSDPRP